MLSPFLVPPCKHPSPSSPPPAPMRVLPYLLPPYRPGIHLHWGIEPSQDQGPLLPLMIEKASLYYIFG